SSIIVVDGCAYRLRNRLCIATSEGVFGELVGRGEIRSLFRVTSSDLYYVKFSGEHILVLSSDHELFVDERAVELGSQLIACGMGTGVIMQMPRGNLETIHPRPFVIRVIKQLLDAGNFVEALKDMKKHRIDMNLIVDYKPDMFIANISKLVATSKDAELICILIAALTNERSMWCDGDVNRVTELLAEEVLNLPDDRRVDMFVVLLSALLKSSPPQVERALRCIKEETNK
ncbi:hypothetical protein OSTOST_18461, partial [Ostertagia ostertagi]